MSINKFGTHREVDDLQQIVYDIKLLKDKLNLVSKVVVDNKLLIEYMNNWYDSLSKRVTVLDKGKKG